MTYDEAIRYLRSAWTAALSDGWGRVNGPSFEQCIAAIRGNHLDAAHAAELLGRTIRPFAEALENRP